MLRLRSESRRDLNENTRYHRLAHSRRHAVGVRAASPTREGEEKALHCAIR
ncbi:MAG: hypothetical protein V7L31_14765 [Nostoc sp.]|uniref:hypothetical protein n=1 Tax=Nostoc sp. TaxID=1180 RepID=UPI002FEEDC75